MQFHCLIPNYDDPFLRLVVLVTLFKNITVALGCNPTHISLGTRLTKLSGVYFSVRVSKTAPVTEHHSDKAFIKR